MSFEVLSRKDVILPEKVSTERMRYADVLAAKVPDEPLLRCIWFPDGEIVSYIWLTQQQRDGVDKQYRRDARSDLAALLVSDPFRSVIFRARVALYCKIE